MTGEERCRCRSCGATLRRGHPGALCDPCARAARSYGQCPVPDGFYDTPDLRAVLADYDFGPVFRAVRQVGALSQEELGLLVGLSQPRVSGVERGTHRLRDVAVIARVAGALGIPARLLGFGPTSAGSVNEGEQEASWVDRRNFINTVTALTLGIGATPDWERLEALLPTGGNEPGPRRIVAADVAAIKETTAAFRLSDFRHGGGICRAAAVAHLRDVLTLRDAACSDEVRADLLLATADLAKTAAWMTYDVERHDAARRLWMIALDTARQSNHPNSTDLTVHMLQDMVHQSLHLGRPEEALRLVYLGAMMAPNRAFPVNSCTRSYIVTNLAWCHASLGEAESCYRALDQVPQIYADADQASAPSWAAHIAPAAIAAQHGHSLFLLSRTDPDYAPSAIEQLRSAVDGYGRDSARSRAAHLPGLAGSYFLAGQVDSAVTIGHDAVTAISTLSSKRTYARLRMLADAAKPHSHHSDVAELRERIRDSLVTVT